MALNITEQQYRTPLQNIQSRYVWIELLNYQYQTVEELSGIALSGSITIDANADIRRTGSIELVINNSTFEVASGGKIWLDKYIRVWVGTMSLLTGQVERVNCGMYIIDAPSYHYDLASNTLTLSLLDLMAKLTGLRNGHIKGTPISLKAGENIRTAIINTLSLGGFNRYIVEEAPTPSVIPTDLDFSQGTTLFEILCGLRDIYPNYEMFFDVDGVFYYKPIPTGQNEPVLVDDSIWEAVVLTEDLNTDFQNVKNSIEVYGRIHDPAYFSTETVVNGTEITLTVASATEYAEDAIYGFILTNNTGIVSPTIRVNTLTAYPLQNDDGTAASIVAEEGAVYFCAQFKGTYWRWLGHLQAYGFAEDNNPNSPFYVEGSVGRIRLPLFDGEYANCLTDALAQQRAEYELWKHTNLNNSLSLNIIPVYWLDVNILVEYTMQRNKIKNQYLIKSVSFGLSPNDSATVSMIQYYPETPTIVSI